MRLTVPSLHPGAKSLPAELKTSHVLNNPSAFPWMRMRAQMPGVWERTPEDYLHYTSLSGLGFDQTVCADPTDPSNCQVISSPDYYPPPDLPVPPPVLSLPTSVWQGPTTVAPNVNPPPPPAGYQWVPALNAAGNTIAKVLAVAQGGASTQTPYGTVIAGSPASAAVTGMPSVGASATGPFGLSAQIGTPMIMVIGLGLMVMFMGMGRK